MCQRATDWARGAGDPVARRWGWIAAGLGLGIVAFMARERIKALTRFLLGARPTWVTPFYQFRTTPRARLHEGADIFVPAGTEVHAPLDGTVRIATGDQIDDRGRGYGTYVVLQHTLEGAQVETLYAHLSQVNLKPAGPIATGATVRAGDVIAWTGTTGVLQTAPHLHFEVIVGWGKPIKAHDVGGPKRLDSMAVLRNLGVGLSRGVPVPAGAQADVKAQEAKLARAVAGEVVAVGPKGVAV